MKNKFSAKEIILSEIKSLKPNEAGVIQARFGLSKDATTLAAIGRQLKLSRERVRQIEKEALKKLSVLIALKHKKEADELISKLMERGGIVSKNEIHKDILPKELYQNQNELNALHLFAILVPEIEKIERHDEISDSFILKTLRKEDVVKVLNDFANFLKNNKKPEKIEVLIENHPNHKHHKISFLANIPEISKKIIKTYEGSFGLTGWSDYNPKTVRDKIYYVLKKYQKPMHFSEIARTIMQEEFDSKKVVPATVHNELIADARFVLIGRGIYALAEWGYKEGTVKEIIKEILGDRGALTFEDLYKLVSKQRFVRKNTVLINLQTQKDFKKIGQDLFMLSSK